MLIIVNGLDLQLPLFIWQSRINRRAWHRSTFAVLFWDTLYIEYWELDNMGMQICELTSYWLHPFLFSISQSIIKQLSILPCTVSISPTPSSVTLCKILYCFICEPIMFCNIWNEQTNYVEYMTYIRGCSYIIYHVIYMDEMECENKIN